MDHQWTIALAGGMTAGLASACYLLVNGRTLGISGILGGLVDGSGKNTKGERMAFLSGLVFVPALIAPLLGDPQTHASGNLALIVLAGLLTGFGTRIANGCTSGHGIIGMTRFSWRSYVATFAYTGAAAVTVFFAKHVVGA